MGAIFLEWECYLISLFSKFSVIIILTVWTYAAMMFSDSAFKLQVRLIKFLSCLIDPKIKFILVQCNILCPHRLFCGNM